MNTIISLACGITFGFGLSLSGMTQPGKVIGFLDFWGDWQWDLLGVMGSALLVNGLAYLWNKKRQSPVMGGDYPSFKQGIDQRLIVGATIFGIGWGLAGICPGPAFVSLFTTNLGIWIFVGMMLVGMIIINLINLPKS